MTVNEDSLIGWIFCGITLVFCAVFIFAIVFQWVRPYFRRLIARRRQSKALKAAERRKWPASPHQISPGFINTAAPPYSGSVSNQTIPDPVRYTQYNMKDSHELQDLEVARITETTH